VATTGAAADEHYLAEVLWQHHRLSGLGIPEAVADAKYGTTFNFLYLGRLGIPTFIPLTRFGNMHRGIWGREHFQWLPEEDAYLCPAGLRLGRHAQDRNTQRVQYRAPRGSCAACPFREQCTPSGNERTVGRSWGQEFVDATGALLAGPLGKQRLVEIRGGRCEDCGYDISIAALEFHHRDSKTKEFGLGNFNGSWERFVAEATKCDLLCANCHRRRHHHRGTMAARGKKARAVGLMGGRCSGCSSVVPDSLFEFHHWYAREKEFGISRDGMTRPWDAIAAELLKCVMLCANCHREIHAGLRQLERQSSAISATAPIGEIAAA